MSKVSFNDAMKDIISSGLRFKVAKDDKGVVSIIIKIGCFYSSITFDSDGCLDQSGFSQDCVSSIVNKTTEPTDLENYIKFLEAAKVEYYKKENEHNTYVSSNLGGHIMELFFELDGSLE
tara:strand:+ start:10229 stop:10588 length:360 start_codon:yes stop_codon:yes gene_type:complete